MFLLSPHFTKAAFCIALMLTVDASGFSAAFQNRGATLTSNNIYANKKTILNAVNDPKNPSFSQNPGKKQPVNKTFVLKKKSINDTSGGKRPESEDTASKKISTNSINNFFQKNKDSDANQNAKGGKSQTPPSPASSRKDTKAPAQNFPAAAAASKKSDKGATNTKPKKDAFNFFSTFSLPNIGAQDKPAVTPSVKTSAAVKTPLEKLNTATTTTSTTTTKSSPSSSPSVSDTVGNFMSKITNPFEKSPATDTTTQPGEQIITNDVTGFTTTIINSPPRALKSQEPDEPRNKFTFEQRTESVKAGVVGLLAGGIALTPFAALHDLLFPDESIANGLAQWEFDTDTGSIATALFAIVYRYCVRDGEQENEMLQMGVVGAFVLVRTLARIRVPVYCSAAPLDCGEPLGYFDWTMIQQGVGSGLESAVMFGATALALEYCYEKEYISRFK